MAILELLAVTTLELLAEAKQVYNELLLRLHYGQSYQ